MPKKVKKMQLMTGLAERQKSIEDRKITREKSSQIESQRRRTEATDEEKKILDDREAKKNGTVSDSTTIVDKS
jgi:hypothetical protein